MPNNDDFKNVTLYDWTFFYRELAEKIAALQGPQELLSKAAECFKQGNPFSEHGKKGGADPFSFLSFLTANQKVFSKVKEVFGLSSDIPSDDTYPQAYQKNALFHDGTVFNPDLLWTVFRKVLKDKKIEKEDFDQVLKINGVAIMKFSSVLFLIDSDNFYSLYPHPKREKLLCLRILDESDAEKIRKNKVNYEDYQHIGNVIKNSFKGCSFHESNLLAYLMFKKKLNISTQYFQINSNVYGDQKNYINDFYKWNAVWTGGRPKETNVKYPLRAPKRGDIMLSHFGQTGNGIGIVLENLYKEDYSTEDSIKVIWINKTEREKAVQSDQMSVMSQADAIRDSFKAVYSEVFNMIEKWQNKEPKESTESKESGISDTAGATVIQHKLNTILYGPPGTGKTYQTIMRAAEIIKKESPKDYDEAREIFEAAKESGRVVFCTFHQSYGYEDFIQGIKPDVDEEDAKLRFTRVDGILKKIATHALYEYYKIYREDNAESAYNDELLSLFWEDLKTRWKESKEELQLKTKTGKPLDIVSIDDEVIKVRHENGTGEHRVRWQNFTDLVHKIRFEDIKNVIKDIQKTDSKCSNPSVYWAVYKKFDDFIKKEGANRDDEDAEDSFAEDDADYQTKKERVSRSRFDWKEVKKINKTEVPAFVLIIDEINRANISNVFGELITLIESDKRLGEKHALDVMLPSGERFGIPNNVYIVGTMNTADKSIALVDIALRRRFYFEPMYPKYDIDGLVGVGVLEEINKKIIEKKGHGGHDDGHDYQIGHSYFIKNNNTLSDEEYIEDTLNHKVLPLLLEYFRNDIQEVEEVMKDTGYQLIKDEDIKNKFKFPLRVEEKEKKAISEQNAISEQ